MSNESNALELADKLQNAANSFGKLSGESWDGGAMLRNLHTEAMALRCTEAALRDEIESLRTQLAAPSQQALHPGGQAEYEQWHRDGSPIPDAQKAPVAPSDDQIMAEVGRCGLGFSETRPLGQQWEMVCELIRRFCARQQAPVAQGEPVAWMRCTDITELTDAEPESDGWLPLYTTPQQASEPMTQEQIIEGYCSVPMVHQYVEAFQQGVRFAERHHNIKGKQ